MRTLEKIDLAKLAEIDGGRITRNASHHAG